MNGWHILLWVDSTTLELAPSRTLQCRIVVSWDLLVLTSISIMMEGRIPCFFTNFITTPESSGPLYISGYSQDIHWRQFVGGLFPFCIEHLSNCFVVLSLFFSIRTGALGNTFPLLFQLKLSFINSFRMPYTWSLGRIDTWNAGDYI